jgi:hypothetical protein
VMPEEHHDAITGHANGSVGRSYGRGVPLKVLAESMAKISSLWRSRSARSADVVKLEAKLEIPLPPVSAGRSASRRPRH